MLNIFYIYNLKLHSDSYTTALMVFLILHVGDRPGERQAKEDISHETFGI